MRLDPRIFCFIVVPQSRSEQTTPLQGFSFSLCNNAWMIRSACFVPSMVFDLVGEGAKTFLARRMGGINPVNWHPVSSRALLSSPMPSFMPFSLIFLDEEERLEDYKTWAAQCEVPPTLVAKTGGDLSNENLSLETLQKRFLTICDLIPEAVEKEDIADARRSLEGWVQPSLRKLDYQVGGHATITPNLMALAAAGFDEMVSGRFTQIDKGVDPYVEQILKTTNSLLELRDEIGETEGDRIYPRPPDVNVFAPAMYAEAKWVTPEAFGEPLDPKQFQLAKSVLERQRGYNYAATTSAQAKVIAGVEVTDNKVARKFDPHPLIRIRQLELSLATECLGALAASEISALVRLPNDINLTSGAVRQFSALYRSARPKAHKRLLAFRDVQESLRKAVPPALMDPIKRSKNGLRLITNAHVEWLDVDGLPLAIRKNVSRIPVTPGNLFVEQLTALPIIHLMPESFKDVLVISALKQGDPIKRMFEIAFGEFEKLWKGHIHVHFKEVATEKDLREAFGEFSGPLVIFDGHGSHAPNEAALLHLIDEPANIWNLSRVGTEVPPIVILSACDTHAADRNHATTANAFLALGARAVLSSVFPLSAPAAAAFVARLLHRVANFLPAAIGMFDRALTWTEVVSGMIRMQLLTDFLRLLLHRKLIDESMYEDVHTRGNYAINGGHEDPFGEVISVLSELGVDERKTRHSLEHAVANSSAISYLHVGRPETIIIDRQDRMAPQLDGDLLLH